MKFLIYKQTKCAKPRFYKHYVVIVTSNASSVSSIVDGLQIVIIRNYDISQGITHGVLHVPPWEYHY